MHSTCGVSSSRRPFSSFDREVTICYSLLFIPCNGTQERVQRDDPKVAMHDGSTFYPLQLRKRAVKDEHGIVGKLVSSIAVFLGDVGGGGFKPLLGLCISKG